MKYFLKVLTTFVLSAWLVSSAAAQTGKLQPGQIWGNPSASVAQPTGALIGAYLDQGLTCSGRGSLIMRGASLWGCFAPSSTAGLPLTSGGTGADLVWAILGGAAGGTGVNNGARTITIGGNFSSSSTVSITGAFSTAAAFTQAGAFATTLTSLGATNVTLPLTGTLATLAGSEAFTNKTYNGNTWTAGTGTLTLGASKTATISNTLTFVGTDGSTVTLGAGGTVAYLSNTLNAFASTTSAQLASVISDETGSGLLVFGTSPTLTTPNIGAATATSINGNVWTAGTGTLTLAAAKVLTANNSITLAGTDGTTWTGPTVNATLASLNINGQVLAGGATVTSLSLSAGNITVNCGSRPLQYVTASTSAWVITAPAADGSCMVLITNPAASAVIPTFSGFTVGSNTGGTLTSANNAQFTLNIWRINGLSGYTIFAHQ